MSLKNFCTCAGEAMDRRPDEFCPIHGYSTPSPDTERTSLVPRPKTEGNKPKLSPDTEGERCEEHGRRDCEECYLAAMAPEQERGEGSERKAVRVLSENLTRTAAALTEAEQRAEEAVNGQAVARSRAEDWKERAERAEARVRELEAIRGMVWDALHPDMNTDKSSAERIQFALKELGRPLPALLPPEREDGG